MTSRDRRHGFRVPVEIFLNQYIRDRPFRGLTCNLSETGLYLQTVRDLNRTRPAARTVGLEFELPGTGEVIWARGEICYENAESFTLGCGIRFTAMPRVHARMLRDFCVESRRTQLGTLLARIRDPSRIAVPNVCG